MNFALAALTFGLVAGLKPGPLGVFIIHQTMSKSNRHGLFASMAPLISDGPIILFSLFLTVQIEDIDWLVSLISILGALYLASLAFKIYKAPLSINPNGSSGGSSSLLTAIKINLLNPAPYVFWLTIGSSYILMGDSLEVGVFIVFALVSLCVTKYLSLIHI